MNHRLNRTWKKSAVSSQKVRKSPIRICSKRIQLRSEQATREIFERHGFLNIAVDLIREGRDEE